MTGSTARLGNAAARPGRIALGQMPAIAATRPDWLPRLVVEFSPSTGPMGPAVWADITDAMIAFSTSRGRQSELNRTEAGTLTLMLANDDRRFDPSNAHGPYAGQLVPRKRIRIRAIWDGVAYPVWMGYAEAWNPPLWRHGKAVCRVAATDGFGLLAEKKVSGEFPEQLTSERISAVLDAAGWSTGQAWILEDPVYGVLGVTTIPAPVGDKSLSAGDTTVRAQTLSNVAALAHIQLMETTENGAAFVDPAGAVTFRSRTERLYPPATDATFGSAVDAGELPFSDAEIDASGDRIYNEVKVARIGGTEQVASDEASIEAYFGRTYSVTGLPLVTDTEALSMATFLLSRYKDFRVRLTGLALEPAASPAALWPQALGRDIGDQIRVVYRPDVGSEMDETVLIEWVQHSFDAERAAWATSWALSPANTEPVWILGDAVRGILGTTTIPAY